MHSTSNSPEHMSAHYFRTDEASAYLKQEHGFPVAPRTLVKLRVVGGGPAFHKFGRSVIYNSEDLIRWAKDRIGQKRVSTSAPTK
jgi:hypothetical protein